MKYFLRLLCIGVMFFATYSCSDSGSGEPSIDELQRQIADLKKILEQNTKISSVAFEGNQMVLTFADGTKITTNTPPAIIPTVGENGNWWINGVDLGVKAEAQIPTVGTNGNWWVNGKDTGVKAQGENGTAGKDGKGIEKIEYDQTTGVLKITLSDKTFFEFVLGVNAGGDGGLGGNKIEDLNGAYLLTKIYNGDHPFAEFTYDAQNLLTGVTYYQNVLNAPVRVADLKREYNSDKKLLRQTATMYAEEDKAIEVSDREYPEETDAKPDNGDYVSYTVDEAFRLLFPNGIQSVGEQDKKAILYEMRNDEYCDQSYLYDVYYNGTDENVGIRREPCVFNTQQRFYLVEEEGEVYFYGPIYYNREGEWGTRLYEYGSIKMLSTISASKDNHGEWNLSFGTPVSAYGFFDKYKAVKHTSQSIDEKEGIKLLDYFMPQSNEVYVHPNVSGQYKILMNEYELYKAGDKMMSLTANYVYDGNNYDVETGGEKLYNVVMSGNKMDKIVVYEGGNKKDLLKFNYVDDLLTTIDAPYENVTGVARIIYNEKNPVELQVNSSKLQNTGYDDVFAELGLAYRYEDYDESLGEVVVKYKYPKDYTPLLKVSYNYGLKNFMNHTFTAMNPLLEGVGMTNAISELIWAGHGSCFMAEYADYNEGGYPQRFKGLLQLSDQIFGTDVDIPANGAVATAYKLEYKKKQ